MGEPEEDDSKIREFNAQRRIALDEKQAKARDEQQKIREKAAADLKDMAAQRSKQKESRQTKNREAQQKYLEDLEISKETDNPWQRVAQLVDTAQQKAKDASSDTSRMRNILLQMKNLSSGPGIDNP